MSADRFPDLVRQKLLNVIEDRVSEPAEQSHKVSVSVFANSSNQKPNERGIFAPSLLILNSHPATNRGVAVLNPFNP